MKPTFLFIFCAFFVFALSAQTPSAQWLDVQVHFQHTANPQSSAYQQGLEKDTFSMQLIAFIPAPADELRLEVAAKDQPHQIWHQYQLSFDPYANLPAGVHLQHQDGLITITLEGYTQTSPYQLGLTYRNAQGSWSSPAVY